MGDYDSSRVFWDGVFSGLKPREGIGTVALPAALEDALVWLSDSGDSILDYGCGSGTLLLKCAARENVLRILGIDLSPEAVALAVATARLNGLEDKAEFICGGAEELAGIESASFHGAILSNIVDNVLPEDAENILAHIRRILAPGGRALVKLNPYLSREQVEEYGMRFVKKDLYLEKDGIFLRNLDTQEWRRLLENRFTVFAYREVHFQQQDQINRVFLLLND